ncbi:hypothetical protein IGI04_019563 [Brassica rapa subsp. trilocularis]|uniref:Uncharacterized protein n=1 Tax=Brassica rapa subsp. trilocularis TaxID=1813537 RepID=A0ABQ7MG85_BRACM|nr:hypothetical protein IGI04_019563 [Brassica rapa subsp. trilocularis]
MVDLLILDMYFCVFYKDDLLVSRLKYNALDDFQEIFQTTSISVVWTSWKTSGSCLDFLEVVWNSWKSSGIPGSLLTKSPFHNRSDRFGFQIWKTSGMTYIQLTIQSSARRLTCKSSRIYEVRWRFFSNQTKAYDLYFSRLRKQISKSIAKITSALTRRLNDLQITSLAHIRLLQKHIISNESDPPRIVSFYDSMNHKKCRIKILGFFSLMWRESERDVVFSS